MRINEIISEGPGAGAGAAGVAAGKTLGFASKGLGAVAGGIVAAPGRAVKGVKQGAATGSAFADKVLSPSKWFGSAAPEAAPPKDDKSPDDSTGPNYISSLDNVVQGRTLSDIDKTNVQQLAKNTFNPQEKAALEAAAAGQKLTDEQKGILQQMFDRL
jgi:hypothetical protein